MITNFPNGISSFGVPIVGGQGLLTQGNSWFVKPNTGSDGNDGKSPDRAFKTLSKAHTAATADQNDVVYYFAQSNTAASTTDYQSATLTWSKDLVHLIGVGAPSAVSQRSRIAQLSTATGVDPLITVSADGCIFSNFQVFQGVDDATSLVAVTVSGTRNYFYNVHFAGIGHATMSAASSADLKLTGSENVFKNCVIGLDTISRDADPAGGIWCDGGASRNMFDDCLIQAYISAAGYPHVTINDTTGIDRWLWFRNCMFVAKSTNKTVTQTEVFDIPAGISQGAIVLQNCYAFSDGGATVWTAGTEGIIWSSMGTPTASAAGGIATNL